MTKKNQLREREKGRKRQELFIFLEEKVRKIESKKSKCALSSIVFVFQEIPYSSYPSKGQQNNEDKNKLLCCRQSNHGKVLQDNNFNSILLTLQQNPSPQTLPNSCHPTLMD